MLPEVGKDTAPVIAALIGCWLVKRQHISYFKQLGKIKYLVLLYLIVPFVTAGLNSDAVFTGGWYLPSLTYYDGVSSVINQFLLIVPFFIGRQFFKTYDHQLLMFKILAIAGLVYSLPILFEVRMSPQLHLWIYGYFPGSFGQQMRLDGFRPVVFMGHGLTVSFFIAIALLSAITLWKNQIRLRLFSPAIRVYYLAIILVLCKSVGALVYGVLAFALIKWTKPKRQHQIAVVLACLTLFYPLMSIMNVFPHQPIIEMASSVDEERAQSLQFRFDNEEILLEHARERIFFGWGGWGRNRVYDQETGKDISVTDGRWIITFGQFGILGFIAEFGFLALTIFRSYIASKRLKSKSEQPLLAAHALMVGIIMIDQLPNSSLSPWLWLLAGILLGRSEAIIYQSRDNAFSKQNIAKSSG
ncbi:MAG: hypothetical protein COA63_012650 [Methylophaga sp.]|nr:hypothetical protein [Methylophaga sp.]